MEKESQRNFKLIELVLLTGLVVTLCLSWLQYRRLDSEVTLKLNNDARIYRDALYRQIQRNQAIVEDLAILFRASEFVSRDEFAIFAQTKFKRHEAIQALEWLPKVLHNQRAKFEATAAKDISGFSFNEKIADGSIVQAQERKIYYPVYYLHPLQGNEAALGIVASPSVGREQAIEQAIRQVTTIASQKITLVQSSHDELGLLFFSPVFDRNFKPGDYQHNLSQLKGFTLGAFKIDQLVTDALKTLPSFPLNMQLYQGNSINKANLIYVLTDVNNQIKLEHSKDDAAFQDDFIILGQHWWVKINPQTGFYEPDWKQLFFYLLLGLLLTSMSAWLVAHWLKSYQKKLLL